jgi:large subunit ribosomal protein L23
MSQVLAIPRVSEKAIALAEKGTYVFEVPTTATKIEVARAVEAKFNVKVTGVNILIAKGKLKRFQRTLGRRSDVKKAFVKLKKGDKIDLFEGAK